MDDRVIELRKDIEWLVVDRNHYRDLAVVRRKRVNGLFIALVATWAWMATMEAIRYFG